MKYGIQRTCPHRLFSASLTLSACVLVQIQNDADRECY